MILCPFHDDRKPSLSIDWEKGLWYCFGCGRSGDVLSLLLSVGLPLREALLAAREQVRTPTCRSPSWPHDLRTLRRWWSSVDPFPCGAGYALYRGFPADLLASCGVDYRPMEIMFPAWVVPGDGEAVERGPVSQVRQAFEGGQYISFGSFEEGRFVIKPAKPPSAVVVVEGPFDALRVFQAVGLDGVKIVSAGGIRVPRLDVPSKTRVVLWPDCDDAGREFARRFRDAYPNCAVVDSPMEDPASCTTDQVRRLLEEVL
jgi:5S rRNA maturation endonuclease (ribonuclease M5)